MTVTDTEPRYQLLDSNGNVVGSLHIDGSGNLVLEEGTNQNEVRLESDGALETTSNATLREGTNQNEATLDSTGTWTVPALDADQVEMGVSGHGPIISKQDADVKVYYGVETDNRSDAYIRAVNQDGVIDEFVGDVVGSGATYTGVLRSAIAAAHDSSTVERSGRVAIIPKTGEPLNLKNPDTASDPFVTVDQHVTVDARGTNIGFVDNGSAAWDLRGGSHVLGHGGYWRTGSDSTTGVDACFLLDGANFGSSTSRPTTVTGFPILSSATSDGFAVEMKQTGGNSVASAYLEVGLRNYTGCVTVESSGAGGYVNDNIIRLRGSAEGATTRGGSGTVNLVETIGSDDAHWNHIIGEDVQVKGTPDHVLRAETGQQSELNGTWADMGNATTSHFFGSGVGGPWTATADYGSTSVTNNSGYAHDIPAGNSKSFAQDLTTLSGVAGMEALHDGTDGAVAVEYGLAVWDPNKASGSGNWVSQVDGTTFGPN